MGIEKITVPEFAVEPGAQRDANNCYATPSFFCRLVDEVVY